MPVNEKKYDSVADAVQKEMTENQLQEKMDRWMYLEELNEKIQNQ